MYQDYLQINEELKRYTDKLGEIPQVVVATKIDMLDDEAKIAEFEAKIGQKVIPVCAIIHEGLEQLIDTVYKKLKT